MFAGVVRRAWSGGLLEATQVKSEAEKILNEA